MSIEHLLAGDFRSQPYWWDRAPPQIINRGFIPPTIDIAVIGGGFTGIVAALTLARAGRGVVLFDGEAIGLGASRRNAGLLNRNPKKSFREVSKSKGLDFAKEFYRERSEAMETVISIIRREQIDCHLDLNGRFIAASCPAHRESLVREAKLRKQHLNIKYEIVDRSEQHKHINSDAFFGGVLLPDQGSLHPGLYHQGLVDRAQLAGVTIAGNTLIHSVEPEGKGKKHRVRGEGVDLLADHVILATNGYTSRNFGWFARRLIPFRGYMAATEVLSPELLSKVMPSGCDVHDTNFDSVSFRHAPDASRILFHAATTSNMGSVGEIAARLHAVLERIIPALEGVKLSHVWTGKCAGTFDLTPHMGRHKGIWYGLGYNFGGIPMATHFGIKIAQQILGLPEGKSIYEQLSFRTMPFYFGNPWFIPYAMRYFAWKDARAAQKSSPVQFR